MRDGVQRKLTDFGMTFLIYSQGKWWRQAYLIDFFPDLMVRG